MPDVDAIGIRHVGELIELMGGTANYTIPDMIRDVDANDGAMSVCPPPGDMNEVMGQETAKWALEVAAAGGHHLMMTGPPGTGKTMLASRIPGIMSPLSESEQLEVASIRSLCGTLPSLWHQRCSAIRSAAPYRIHRHPWSAAARDWLKPGGDHAGASGHPIHGTRRPNSRHGTLQTLREPLESGYVALSRSKAAPITPASFQLDHGGQPLSVRILLRHRRTLRLPGKRPYTLFLAIVRTDIGSCGYSDGGATSLAHCRAKRANRRVQCRDTSSCDSCPSSGQRSVQTVWMGVQRASFGQMAARQYIAESDGIGQSGPVQSSTHIARADRAMRLSWTLADLAAAYHPLNRTSIRASK